ncbi:MAG: DUF3047 domain-containing protein [Magnetococcales bacterium]|nr:DUF3047 domain-containing protein [Magnetococcales bacterium]
MASEVLVGNFQAGDLSGWKYKIFNKKTIYTIQKDNVFGNLLVANSYKSASGMYRKVTVDLNKTPCLNWSWKIDNVLSGLDERTKAGDDYPARIYVVLSGGVAIWNTRTINYVWSSNVNNIGKNWISAYTNKAVMVSLQGGPDNKGALVFQKRNIKKDFLKYFKKNTDHIDVVALMTDTDNSGQKATTYYGNIFFSDSCQ